MTEQIDQRDGPLGGPTGAGIGRKSRRDLARARDERGGDQLMNRPGQAPSHSFASRNDRLAHLTIPAPDLLPGYGTIDPSKQDLEDSRRSQIVGVGRDALDRRDDQQEASQKGVGPPGYPMSVRAGGRTFGSHRVPSPPSIGSRHRSLSIGANDKDGAPRAPGSDRRLIRSSGSGRQSVAAMESFRREFSRVFEVTHIGSADRLAPSRASPGGQPHGVDPHRREKPFSSRLLHMDRIVSRLYPISPRDFQG